MENNNNINNSRQAATRITQHSPFPQTVGYTIGLSTQKKKKKKKKKKKSNEIESGPNTKVSTHSFESP